MDLMIGTVDFKRLRQDLLRHYRASPNRKSPVVWNAIDTVEMADEQELIGIAKKEGIEIRKYIR